VARRSYGKARCVSGDTHAHVAAAEDALQRRSLRADRLAGERVSANPEAWLLTVARRKTIDMHRGRRRDEIASEELRVLALRAGGCGSQSGIPDQRLALMFVCAHPAIDASVRAPLILQTCWGLMRRKLRSAFLMSPAAMGKRLVRAKDKIRQAGISFSVPEREELAGRLDTVLDAIYAAFAEGWTDPGGTDARAP